VMDTSCYSRSPSSDNTERSILNVTASSDHTLRQSNIIPKVKHDSESVPDTFIATGGSLKKQSSHLTDVSKRNNSP
jgi:hypothetical protein